MTLYQAQVHLAAVSSIPADVAVNSYHFRVDSGPVLTDEDIITGQRDGIPDENGIQGDLSDLYDTIADYLSIKIDPAASYIKWYNLDLPKPRTPFLTLSMDSFTTVGSDTLPSEVAIVSSFQAAPVNGLPQSRRRNRVYLGPLSSLGLAAADGVINSSCREAIAGAFENLASNSASEAQWIWVVYSPTDDDNHAIADGWIDNAFDSQRRRGIESYSRETWTQSSI